MKRIISQTEINRLKGLLVVYMRHACGCGIREAKAVNKNFRISDEYHKYEREGIEKMNEMLLSLGNSFELSKLNKFNIIYRHTHKDYKSKLNGVKMLLVDNNGRDEMCVCEELSDYVIENMYTVVAKKEAKRIAKKSKQ